MHRELVTRIREFVAGTALFVVELLRCPGDISESELRFLSSGFIHHDLRALCVPCDTSRYLSLLRRIWELPCSNLGVRTDCHELFVMLLRALIAYLKTVMEFSFSYCLTAVDKALLNNSVISKSIDEIWEGVCKGHRVS
jgi:hypothetical protein